MKRIEYILKHNLFLQKLYICIFSLIFRILGFFVKVDKKKILFLSLIGKDFGNNPKALFEAIKSDIFFKDYEFIWAFENPDDFSIDVKKVKLNSLHFFLTALSSGIWISNTGIERNLRFKPKKTIYINTGHGTSFKFDGNAQKNRNDYNFSSVDFQCATSSINKKIIARDWKIPLENIHITGYPMDDELYYDQTKRVKKLKEKLSIPFDKKVICYAPTWRDSINGGESYEFNPPIHWDKFKRLFSKDYVLLFRSHHLTTNTQNVDFDNFIFDGCKSISTNDALLISDILISDYSSIMFDYSILGRPIICFAFDLSDYKEKRGLYFEPNSIFTTVYTEDELIECLKKIDYEKECEKSKLIKKKYMVSDGHATEACVKYLKKQISMKNCKNLKNF